MPLPKVVIIGGGFGGLNVALSLKKANVDIVLIDKMNHHLFQPLLYQVASAALSPADIAVPLRELLRNQKNTTVIMGEVVHVDKENRKLILGNGDIIYYDYLVVSIGTSNFYFGNDHWMPLATGLKTLEDALTIREDVLISFEKAERLGDTFEASKYLSFAIIGGGPTGVEMAGSIAEIANKTLFKDFRRIKPEKSKIYLIEGSSRILPSFPLSLSRRAHKDLEEMGVEIITNKTVTDISKDIVKFEDGFVEAKNVIWAAGIAAPKLLKTLDTPLDKRGRAIVDPDLSIPNKPEVFVIGDAAHVKDKHGNPLPGIGPAAIQEGKHVAKIIKKRIPKEKRRAFKYWDKGMLATIGRAKAVGESQGIRFTGFFAWIIWAALHIFYLIHFRNRFQVMLSWTFHYLTGTRGARLIKRGIDEELPQRKKFL